MKKIILSLSLFFAFEVYALTGFSGGDTYTVHDLRGNLTVYCPGSQTRSVNRFSCHYNSLSPEVYSYFVTDKNVDADSVELVVHHEDGSKKDKKSGFKNGRSVKPFNLWIRTLLQRPLLEMGKNIVKYKLKKADAVVLEGMFSVAVDKGETRYCHRGTMTGYSDRDCRASAQYAQCSAYFSRNNYCQ